MGGRAGPAALWRISAGSRVEAARTLRSQLGESLGEGGTSSQVRHSKGQCVLGIELIGFAGRCYEACKGKRNLASWLLAWSGHLWM